MFKASVLKQHPFKLKTVKGFWPDHSIMRTVLQGRAKGKKKRQKVDNEWVDGDN